MSKDKKKGRISRIRNNLKYENNDPLWKKLFYIKENLKQYKGVVIAVILTILLIIICILFVTLSKNRIKNNDIIVKEEVKKDKKEDKKRELTNKEDIEKYVPKSVCRYIKENKIYV